jgi:CheY-like chemotaxis protein
MSHRIIIVDDHPLFRSALRQTLEGEGADTAFEEAGDIEGLSAALEANRDCDLVLLDLNMPGVRGFSGLLLLRAQFPEIPVMIVSAVDRDHPGRWAMGSRGRLARGSGRAERSACPACNAYAAADPRADDALGRADEQADRL